MRVSKLSSYRCTTWITLKVPRMTITCFFCQVIMLVSKWRKTYTDTEHSLYCLLFFSTQKRWRATNSGHLEFFCWMPNWIPWSVSFLRPRTRTLFSDSSIKNGHVKPSAWATFKRSFLTKKKELKVMKYWRIFTPTSIYDNVNNTLNNP